MVVNLRAILDLHLLGSYKFLLITLASRAEAGGWARVTLGELESDTGASKGAVTHGLEQLEARGFIVADPLNRRGVSGKAYRVDGRFFYEGRKEVA